MTNRTKIIIGIIAVIVIIAVIFGIIKNKKSEDVETEEKPVEYGNVFDYINDMDENEQQNNVIENNSVVEENLVEENLVEENKNNTTQNSVTNTVIGKEEQESSNENTKASNEEKAVELAKKEWAISVNSYEFQPELQNDGTYIVKVINKTNRNEVTRYTVNVEKGTVVEAE